MKKGIIYFKTLILLCCIFSFLHSNAQEIAVNGKLVDSVSAKPVANATINFLQPQKKISTTIISDQNGAFKTNLVPGGYKVTITHSSFKKKGMHMAIDAQAVDLGSIQMIAAMKSLAEVKVIATRPLVEQQADKLIYNVDEDPSAKTESASDILRKTPYVTVDGEGGVQVNGQANFKVLLNGRETALFSQNVKEALKSFPGATISRIEVITSPSAKYDAEGVGGIINIITKKKLAGYNGTANSNISKLGHRGAGFNFNVKTGKLGISAMYNHMTNGGIRSHQLSITTPDQPVAFAKRQVGGIRNTEMYFHQANLELSYDLDSTKAIVVYGNIGRNKNETVNQQTINTLFANGNADISPFLLATTMSMPTHGFGADYIRKFKGKPQKEFNFRFNAIYNTNNSLANSQQDFGSYDRFMLNNSEAFNSEYTIQADLVQPVNKSTKFETGIKSILRKAHSDFESQVRFNKAEPYLIDPANSDRFFYDQNVYGAYVSVNKVTKAITARIGLRIEHTLVDGEFASTNTTVSQQYTNLIPNLLLSKQFSKTMSSNFTYTFRLGRPSISSLNPFVNNSDSLNISYGNPDLGPQFIHQFAWQNRFFKGSKFISIQTGFNFSNNVIIQNPSFDAATGVSSVTTVNAGQIREFTLGFTSNLPVRKWNFALNTNGRTARMRNSLQTSWFNTVAGSVNANVSYKASNIFTIASNNGYFVPLRTPNNVFPENYFYGFNFIFKLFKAKMNLTASVTNFFEKERDLKFVTENAFFRTETVNTIPFRNFGLSMNYSFGKLKEKVSKKKGINNDDQVE